MAHGIRIKDSPTFMPVGSTERIDVIDCLTPAPPEPVRIKGVKGALPDSSALSQCGNVTRVYA